MDRLRDLELASDGPLPPAEAAAVRWGRAALGRLAAAADAALIEARLRACIAGLACARTAPDGRGDLAASSALVAQYRALAMARRV